jgi:hypothetical protein
LLALLKLFSEQVPKTLQNQGTERKQKEIGYHWLCSNCFQSKFPKLCKTKELKIENKMMPWRRGLLVTPPPRIEEIGAMGRKIESRQFAGW